MPHQSNRKLPIPRSDFTLPITAARASFTAASRILVLSKLQCIRNLLILYILPIDW